MGRVTFNFEGEQVLVTGASRGIGYAVARAFARAGADVTILAEDEGVMSAAQTLSEQAGRAVRGLRCDITEASEVAAALAGIERIDVLVNNAGVERITPLEDPDPAVEETFRRLMDINVAGPFLVTRHAAARMVEGGRIVMTASIWSRTAVPEFSAYVASKHANLGFMRSMAHELGPRGIRVNAVCPGWVRTEGALRSLASMAARAGRPEEALLEEIVSAQVLGGLMEPEDIAGLYLFLASDAAKDITGQAYTIDRGEVMA